MFRISRQLKGLFAVRTKSRVSNSRCSGIGFRAPRPKALSPVAKTVVSYFQSVAAEILNLPSAHLTPSRRRPSINEVSHCGAVVGIAIHHRRRLMFSVEASFSYRVTVSPSRCHTTSLRMCGSTVSPGFPPINDHRVHATLRLRPSADGSISSAPSAATITRPS